MYLSMTITVYIIVNINHTYWYNKINYQDIIILTCLSYDWTTETENYFTYDIAAKIILQQAKIFYVQHKHHRKNTQVVSSAIAYTPLQYQKRKKNVDEDKNTLKWSK